MNILLLNPPYIKEKKVFMKEIGRCGSTASANQYWPQTGLAYLAAVAEKSHNVKIIDAIAERKPIKEIIKDAKEYSPKVIVFHTTTPTFKNDAKVMELLKKEMPGSIFGFVGGHVSNSVRESLENSDANFVIVNEPEITFNELLENLNRDWSNIRGIGYRDKQEIHINTLRDLNSSLDTLPLPARHLLPNERYRMILTNNQVFATVIPSRGCPHSCIYCRVGLPWGKRFRKRSPDNIVDELKEIKYKYQINNVVFMADTFTLDKKWVLELTEKMINERLGMNWLCNSRIDTIDEEMLTKMKRAGCSLISYGVESGSQKILDLAKKSLDLSKVKETIELTKKAKIRAFTYFIIGLPGEDRKTIKETVEFAKYLNPDYVNFHIATPHPGTELYELAKTKNWIVDYDYEHYDQSGNYAVMRNGDLTAEEILNAQKNAMKSFYLRPNFVLRQLLKINKPIELLNLAKIGFKIARKKG